MDSKQFIKVELERCLTKRKIILLLVFFILATLILQSGIWQFKSNLEEVKRFKEYEGAWFGRFLYYAQYSTYGFKILYLPGPIGALFSNAGIISSRVNVNISSNSQLPIYESLLGKNPFFGYTTVFFNLTGCLFLLSSLLALFYGVESFKDKEFLEFLSNVKSNRFTIFKLILISRLLFLLGIHLILAFLTWVMFLLNGSWVNPGWLTLYFFVAYLMAAFFLLIGMLTNTIKEKGLQVTAAFALWFLFIFVLPATIGKIVHIRSESLVSTYKLDLEKFKLLMSIEKRAAETAGRLDIKNPNTPIRQKLYEYFWKNEFQQIFAHEQEMINGMKEVAALHFSLSSLFPTSFFLSTNNEITSRGYQNLLSFYEQAFKHQKGFIQYYAEKSFFKGEKKVIPYLKGDELIITGSSKLPGSFGFGILISIIWVMALIVFNWIVFKGLFSTSVNSLPVFGAANYELPLERFVMNKTIRILTKNPVRIAQLLEKLRSQKIPHIFIPAPHILPGDVTIKSLLALFALPAPGILPDKTWGFINTLTLDEKAELFFYIVKSLKTDFMVFDNYLYGLSKTQAEKIVRDWPALNKDKRIVYFSAAMQENFLEEDDLILLPGEPKSLW